MSQLKSSAAVPSSSRASTFQVESTPCFWVDDESSCDAAVAELSKSQAFAVDLEGDCLGHKGRAATIQLATAEVCYIIDLAAIGMPTSLRDMLQAPCPVKVCHGFSGDQINMIEQFGLDFAEASLFDTQVAVSSMKHSGGYGCVDVLEAYSDAPASVLQEMRSMKKKVGYVNFFRRPLPEPVARYVCLDVIFLPSAYTTLKNQLREEVVAEIMKGSLYCGPYARGACYRPPTEKQLEKHKGKVWSEELHDFVRASHDGTSDGHDRDGQGNGRDKGKGRGNGKGRRKSKGKSNGKLDNTGKGKSHWSGADWYAAGIASSAWDHESWEHTSW